MTVSAKQSYAEIQSKVVEIIVDKLGVDASEVTLESNFTNDLGADSLDAVELIMEFEKEFKIAISDDQAENLATVGDVISFIFDAK
ncbi:acyl carrier protein [Crocinitomicaceae bacterium]|nr:acyl carrier protein [Crocinitomicaceae bacterium]